MNKSILILLSILATLLIYAEAKEKFSGPTFRVIDGKTYDFTEVHKWANENYVSPSNKVYRRPRSDSMSRIGGSVGDSKPSKQAQDEAKKRAELQEKYKDLVVDGTVFQILKEGVVVECTKGDEVVYVLLRNHPDQQKLVDKDPVLAIALRSGSFQLNQMTIANYDFGRPFSQSDFGLPVIRY